MSTAASAPALVAILRGLDPDRALEVVDALYEAGVRLVEVPLNSPEPFKSIERIARLNLADLTVGAGTVLAVPQVERARDAGGTLIVSPNCDTKVIGAALAARLRVMPGFATATEMFQAIAAGASELKLFPASALGCGYLKALSAVLPAGVAIYPVGGVSAGDIPSWLAAGARGFGFGSELFRPDYSIRDIGERARALVQALNPHTHTR